MKTINTCCIGEDFISTVSTINNNCTSLKESYLSEKIQYVHQYQKKYLLIFLLSFLRKVNAFTHFKDIE